MKIAIYGSKRQQPYLPEISAFLDCLARVGVEVVMHAKLYDHLSEFIPRSLGCVSQVTASADFSADRAVSIGGDGTFLRTAMWVADKCIPIVGVNTGHLGYLSALGVESLPELPQMLMSDDALEVQRRSLIVVGGLPERACPWPYALNEVAFSKEETASMITACVELGGAELTCYRGDGLIVCTPTGSTAYNLSVGGPIVQPDAPVMVVSPVATHSLSMRPMVVSAGECLSVKVQSRARHFRVALDGRSVVMPVGTELTLSQAPFCTMLMMPRGHSFADTLRDKLHWGVD